MGGGAIDTVTQTTLIRCTMRATRPGLGGVPFHSLLLGPDGFIAQRQRSASSLRPGAMNSYGGALYVEQQGT